MLRRNVFRLIFALVVVLSILPGRSAGAEPVTVRRELPNGALLLVRERPTAGVVSISIAVRSGSRDASPGESGWHSLLNRAHFLGTPSWPTEDELRRTIGATGGNLGGSADEELSRFTVTVPAREFDLALSALSEIVNAPRIDPAALERTRRQQLTSIARQNADPQSIAFNTLQELALAGQPTASSSLGTVESVSRVSRAALVDLRERTLVGRNLIVAAVGQIAPERALDALTAAFGSLPAGQATTRPALPIVTPASSTLTERRAGQQQSIVLVGVPTGGRTDPDYYPLLVLGNILGGSGRIFEEVRTNRGLAYQADAGVRIFSDAGYFYAFAGTDPVNTDEVLGILQAELDRIVREPVDEATVQDAKNQLSGRRLLGDETSSAQADRLAILTALGAYISNDDFLAAVARVAPADVQRVAARYLGAGRHVIIVRPAAER